MPESLSTLDSHGVNDIMDAYGKHMEKLLATFGES